MITVSIVTYKTNLEELSKCLQSLISSLVSQIYIVDNSNERYIADFCQQYPNVIYIGSENVGYGAGHNQALRQVLNSGGKYHLILNSDVYFEPSVLEFLAAYMDTHADVAQVQPNVVYPDGEQQYTCRLLPTPANLIFRRFLPKRMVEKMNIRYQLKFDDHKKEMNVPYHQGSFMFFRLRMHKWYRTMFVPSVTIVHAHRAASYKSKKMLKIHMVNMIKYFNKWGWIVDKERSAWNRKLLEELGYKK